MRTEREAMGLPPLPTPSLTSGSTPTEVGGAAETANDGVQGGVPEPAGLEEAAAIRTEAEEEEELMWLVWPFQDPTLNMMFDRAFDEFQDSAPTGDDGSAVEQDSSRMIGIVS
ncbi:unnamed protein product, partial [Ectocarpus fasciculatus]